MLFRSEDSNPIINIENGKNVIGIQVNSDPISLQDGNITYSVGDVSIEINDATNLWECSTLRTFVPVGEEITVKATTATGLNSTEVTTTIGTLEDYIKNYSSNDIYLYLGTQLTDLVVPNSISLKVGEKKTVSVTQVPLNPYHPSMNIGIVNNDRNEGMIGQHLGCSSCYFRILQIV